MEGANNGKRARSRADSPLTAGIGFPDVTRRFRDVASQSASVAGPGDPAAARVAGRQHAVISAEQAELCGLSRKAQATRRLRGQWQDLHPGVYLLGVAPPTYPARVLAAVMARAPAVAAGGISAAWLNGMLERLPSQIDITILDGRNRAPLERVRFHRPRALLPDRVFWRQGIPVISPADALFELATTMDPAQLEAVCALALHKGLVSRSALARRLDISPPRAGIRALRAAAADPRLTRSRHERLLCELVALAELPAPETNVVIHGKELDLYWPEAKLGIEVDAYGTHGGTAAFEDDRKLDSDLAAADLDIRRFTGRRISEHPYAVIARVTALLTLKLGGLPPPRRV